MSTLGADPSAERYRLPTSPPLRRLYVASLTAVVGFVEVLIWAAIDGPRSLLGAGVALLVLATCLAAQSLIWTRQSSWTLYVSVDGCAIVQRSQRTELAWTDVTAARLVGPRLVISRTGAPPVALRISGGAAGTPMLSHLLQALDAHITASRPGAPPADRAPEA